MPDQTTVRGFVRSEIERVQRFARWWTKQHGANSKDFPANLAPDEWNEQYRLWQEVVEARAWDVPEATHA